MLFKFPQKKIVLDCFTNNELIAKTAPIVPAMKLIPDWWKTLPSDYPHWDRPFNVSTMKHCVGMIDYYRKSIAIPFWTDLNVEVTDTTYEWKFSDGMSKIEIHDISKQATGFLNDAVHIKIIAPWMFKTKESVSWVWSCPTYEYAKAMDVTHLPGIVDFQHQHGVNINFLLQRKLHRYEFKQGRPATLLTPMSDRKIEIVRHVVSKAEFNRLSDLHVGLTFRDKYLNIKKRTEQFADCPYHMKK